MSDTPIFDELREAVVEWVEAREDPVADPADFLDRSYDDSDEGADDIGIPITSLGGSELLIWLVKRRFGKKGES